MRDAKYFPNFVQLSSMLRIKPESLDSKRKIAISADLLKELIIRCLAHVEFDEDWYLSTYPDVKKAWEKGQINDLRTHFIETGYFEGRFPHEMTVDEKWYLDKYEDVREAIASGKAASAAQHYLKNGLFEWRSPNAALEQVVNSWLQLSKQF